MIDTFVVPATITEGQTAQLRATASDPADPLTFTWVVRHQGTGAVTTLTGPTVYLTPAAGSYSVELTVTDGDGGTVTVRRTTTVFNAAPVASAGGPYDVPEGGAVALDALTGTTDANQPADTLTYAWDFDGDGTFGEPVTGNGDERGSRPTFRATTLDGS